MDKIAAAIIIVGASLLLTVFFAFILQSTQQPPVTTPTPSPTNNPPPTNTPQPTGTPASTPIQTSPNLTVNTTNIEWGTLQAGKTSTQTVTVTNTGDAPTQPLHMSHSQSNVGEVAWNLETVTLKPGQHAKATLILQTYFNAPPGDFTIEITVTG